MNDGHCVGIQSHASRDVECGAMTLAKLLELSGFDCSLI